MVNLFSLVAGTAAFLKTRDSDKIKTDNIWFRLHYDFTTAIMFLSVALLGLAEMWGDNINCISNVRNTNSF